MGDITGADAVVMLSIPTLFDTPQQLQGFGMDDVYDIDQVQSVETVMGVDGVLSGGFVFKEQVQRITLQADSPSNAIFDTWHAQMVAARRTYPANGIVSIPSVGLKFIQTIGYLTAYKLPGVKKLVLPRQYGITWNLIAAAPI